MCVIYLYIIRQQQNIMNTNSNINITEYEFKINL